MHFDQRVHAQAERGVLYLRHLIVVERNDSLRVDRQLIGRVARQGDPGSYQFFLSAQDALVERVKKSSLARIGELTS